MQWRGGGVGKFPAVDPSSVGLTPVMGTGTHFGAGGGGRGVSEKRCFLELQSHNFTFSGVNQRWWLRSL